MSQQNGISSTFSFLLMGVVFLIVGVYVTFFLGAPTLNEAKASENWPTTDGVVVESTISKQHIKKKTTYTPEICYEYLVYRQKQFGSRITIGGTTHYSSSAKAHRVANEYPIGKTVEVAYDPENPAAGVLDAGVNMGSYLAIILGVVFSLVGLLMAVIPGFKLFAAMFAISSSLKSEPQGIQPYAGSTQQHQWEHTESNDNHRGRKPVGAASGGNEIGDGFTIN